MPAVELPNGQSAILHNRDEISERVSRRIARAYMVAGATAARLVELGYDESNPLSWAKYADLTDEERNNLDGYEAELVVGFVKSWSLEATPTLDVVLDLPRSIFRVLADASLEEWNRTDEFGPDGVNDPKAPTGGLDN